MPNLQKNQTEKSCIQPENFRTRLVGRPHASVLILMLIVSLLMHIPGTPRASGDLGLSSDTSRLPMPSAPYVGAAAIATGNSHTCGLMTSGGVKCWGWNFYDQLGDGTNMQRLTPINVIGLTSGVIAITAAESHTCALTATGGVKCWGSNNYAELGNGTTIQPWMPVDVTGLTSGVSAIAAGGSRACALMMSGGVKCWGFNDNGQLGDGGGGDPCGVGSVCRLTPVDVSGLTTGVNAISAGEFHTCALMASGGVKCWGLNQGGRLGDGTTIDRSTPVDVSGLTSGVIAISAGGSHTCALTTSSGIKCWGFNYYGQLGDGTTINRYTPVDVSGLTSSVSAISAGIVEHTCALMTSGGVKCWGYNGKGQLGDGTIMERHTPVDVSGLTNSVAAISAGMLYSCALMTSSGIKCWGQNWSGELGDGTITERHFPVSVMGFPSPLLDLPFNYEPHTPGTFAKLATYPTVRSGRINSWFDHNLPTYGPGNGQLQYWNGFTVTNNVSGDICLQYGACYDGHNGIDFQTDGQPILAAASGTVLNTITNTLKIDCIEFQQIPNNCGNGYGNQIWIDHHNGYTTLYGHLMSGAISVTVGQNVTQGQPIAQSGNSGNGRGHLHFGLYYDTDGDGTWTGEWAPGKPNEVVDPYGWSSNLNDPWLTAGGPASQYLWLYPVGEPVAYIPSSGVTFTSPSGTIHANIPANAYPSSLTLDLSEGPVAAPSAQLRITGHSFVINATSLGGLGPSRIRRPLASSSITLTLPATLTVNYTASDITHLSEYNLGVYRWDDTASVWNSLTSSVDINNKEVTAQTDQFGAFALFAPPLCIADVYEPNDTSSTALLILGQSQSQLFDSASDADWIKFNVVAGSRYDIRTVNLATSVDTLLTLYDHDGVSAIATDDNSGGGKASRLLWQAPSNGTYFVRISRTGSGISGCNASYEVSVTPNSIFLPLIMR